MDIEAELGVIWETIRQTTKKEDWETILNRLTELDKVVKPPEQELVVKLLRARVVWRMGNIEVTRPQFLDAIAFAEKHNLMMTEIGSSLFHFQGWDHYDVGDYEGAIACFSKSIHIKRAVSDYGGLGYSLNMVARILIERGDIEEATKKLQQAKDAFENVQETSGLMIIYSQLARIAILRGDMKEAEALINQTLEILEMGKPPDVLIYGWIRDNIAYVCANLGMKDEAERHYAESLDDFREYGLEVDVAQSLMHLIELNLAYGDLRKATWYFIRMNKDANKESEFRLWLFGRYCEALMEHSKPRSLNKAKAEMIYLEILNDRTIKENNELMTVKIPVMRNLTELRLIELRNFGYPPVEMEINALIDEMQTVAESQKLTYLLIEVLILKSKMLGMQGEFNEAPKLAERAVQLAEERRLFPLATRARQEAQILNDQFVQMKESVGTNPSWAEKFDRMKVLEYIERARKLK